MYFPIFILVFYIKYILLHLIRLLTIVGFPLTLRQFHICKYRLNKIAARWPAKAVAQFYFY